MVQVDGTATHFEEFWDEETKQTIKINLSYRDIVLFRLLKQIAENIKRG